MAKQEKTEALTIKAPRFETIKIGIVGAAPLLQNKFSQKAKQMMMETQQAGSTAKSKKAKEAKDFEALSEGAAYRDKDGTYGINAASFRNAAISACRLVGFKMTLAKLSLFIEADGYDAEDYTPLVHITHGLPEMSVMPARNATGVIDLRPRPMWREWGATLRIRYDRDQFTAQDIINLVQRIGMQVGIGEGRPDSKQSAGLGFGLFNVDKNDVQIIGG